VDTLLIERYGFLGGTMIAGLVNPFMTFHASKEQIVHGIFQEIIDRLKRLGGYDDRSRAFDVEMMKNCIRPDDDVAVMAGAPYEKGRE